MFKYFRLSALLLTLLVVSMSPANATTWNLVATNSNDTVLYFFDADTAVRKGDVVTLWLKYITDPKVVTKTDSPVIAQKLEYSCTDHTVRKFNTSFYDKDGKLIRAYPAPETPETQTIEPNSVHEHVRKTACSPNFPKSDSKDQYFAVKGNNIFQYAADYFKAIEESKTDRAPN